MTEPRETFACPHLAWRFALEATSWEGITQNLLVSFNSICDRPEHIAFESNFETLCRQFTSPGLRTVINTVFPLGLHEDNPRRQDLYAEYARIYPSIKKVGQNRRGT